VRGPSEAELDDLMDRLADGDRSAFTPLFEALYPRALAVARRRLDDAHAEDAAQRTMTAIFARAVEFTPGRPVLPWFYAIAANETHAVARKVRITESREAPASAASLVPADDDPERALSLAEMRALLREALATLDPLSAAAIEGQLADIPSDGPRSPAVRKRLSRAYARLRSVLGGAISDEEKTS
jgi:RNA polymerase sigma factor (sigma-70 family)